MSFHVKDNFFAGPVSQVTAAWFNSVARFLNNLCGGLGIVVMRDTTPPQIALDVDKAKQALAVPSVCPNAVDQSGSTGDTAAQVAARAPKNTSEENDDGTAETTAQKTARIGTSSLVAREDHVHLIPTEFKKSKSFAANKGVTFKNSAGGSLMVRGGGTSSSGFFFAFLDGNTANRIFYLDAASVLTLGGGTVSDIRLPGTPTDTDSTTSNESKRIATLGWANGHFWRKVTNATGFLFNTNGTLSHVGYGGNGSATTVSRSDHTHSGYAPASHTHPPSGIVATAATGLRVLVVESAATSASLRALVLEDLKYTDSAHSGNCLIKVDDSGNVSHTGNSWYNTLEALVAGYNTTSEKLTSVNVDDGTNKSNYRSGSIELFHTTPFIDFHLGNSAADYTSRIIEYSDGLALICTGADAYAYLNKHPADTSEDTSQTTISARRIATVGFVNSKTKAVNPSSTTSIQPAIARVTSGTAPAADATTWTAGGQNGLAIRKLCRVVVHAPSSGNAAPVIYGFYRTETYDAMGRLYSVSGETRQVIDETVLLTWKGS